MRNQVSFDHAIPPMLTRLLLGSLFLVAGLQKFMGPGAEGFMKIIAEMFRDTILPQVLLKPYGYCLPFIEVALGLFLIAGLYRRAALLATGALLLSLAFGQLLKSEGQSVFQIAVYLFITSWTIRESGKDVYNLDHLFER